MENKKLKAWTLRTLEGKNDIYNNWHKYTGITKGAYIDALEWLFTGEEIDILSESGERVGFRRKLIKCEKDGTITKMIQVNNLVADRNWYEFLDGTKYPYSPDACQSASDRYM